MKSWPIVRSQAELDITEAVLWYESERPGLGADFLAEIEYSFQRIAENPEQFPELGIGVRRALLRRFPYGVYFVAETLPAKVLAVLHLHRNPETWKSRV